MKKLSEAVERRTPERACLSGTQYHPELRDEFRWETINAVVYKLGGVVFIVGSVLFFPGMSAYADLGAWAFIVGSLHYLLVTGHDMAEVIRHSDSEFRRLGNP